MYRNDIYKFFTKYDKTHYIFNSIIFRRNYIYTLICKMLPKKWRYEKYKYTIDSSKAKNVLENLRSGSVYKPWDYFRGYFFNIEFFEPIRDVILRDFSLKTPLDSKNAMTKKHILNTKDSVFLHIRRGDYMGSSVTAHLGASYYSGALKIIKERLGKAHIFVFSNDINWCKENLLQSLEDSIKEGLEFEFVDNNHEGGAAFELELMKSCKHAIMANSTFSFWGAYLIENDDKIVVMPNRYNYADKGITRADLKEGQKTWRIVDIFWGREVL